MVWNRNRAPKLVDDLQILIDDLCDEWNFCNKVSAEDLTENNKTLRALDFITAVIVAEGLKPEDEVNWMRRIKRKFVARYGQSVSTASYHM